MANGPSGVNVLSHVEEELEEERGTACQETVPGHSYRLQPVL